MRQSVRTAAVVVLGIFLLAPVALVHCLGSACPASSQTAKSGSTKATKQSGKAPVALPIFYGTEDLPRPVREMREAILTAVQSGRIEDLRIAFELNELKPDLGEKLSGDPVPYWRRISGDGEGREILAIVGEVLDAGHVVLPLGKDLENNKVYVWPYFAELPPAATTPSQQVELLRLVSPAMAKEMQAQGRYTYWRVSIGADGTWHSFRKGE